MNLHRLLTLGVLAVATPAAAVADQVPQLSLNARMIHSDGSPGGSSGSPHPMVVGQGVTSYLFATENLCGLGAADASAKLNESGNEPRRGYVWKVTRTGVSHVNGLLTFDLDWTRYDGGTPVASASSKQRLSLHEGTSYPIDLIRASTAGSCKAGAVIVDITAGATEAPAFADTVLQYDLWLTHQDASGEKQIKHFVVSAKQGAAGRFEFSPMRFDVPKLAPDQYDLDLVTRVLGAVKGRLREDGKVNLELLTQRMDRLERRDNTKTIEPRAGGRKTLELLLDETVEIELPRTSGTTAHVASPQSPGISGGVGIGARQGPASALPPVALKDGSIVVSIRDFFDGDRFSIMIRVRKE